MFMLDFLYFYLHIFTNMNYNYPYYAGYLEYTVKSLATDVKFLALTNSKARQDYVDALIQEAKASMVKNSK